MNDINARNVIIIRNLIRTALETIGNTQWMTREEIINTADGIKNGLNNLFPVEDDDWGIILKDMARYADAMLKPE